MRRVACIIAAVLVVSLAGCAGSHQEACSGGCAPAPPTAAPLPQFPWPPPQYTAKVEIPARLYTSRPHDQNVWGNSIQLLTRALYSAGIDDWSIYGIGRNGFAVVGRLESINDDGTPQKGRRRWATPKGPDPDTFDLTSYLSALFSARKGRYRVIVLAVTSDLVTSTGRTVEADSAMKWVAGGAERLPLHLARLSVDSTHCTALIYEFARPSEYDRAVIVGQSGITAVQHLARAGLWPESELRQ